MYSLRGKSYESAGAIAEAFGVSLKKFNWRIENGWALEEALELIQRKKPQAKIAVLGDKIFYSQREMALHFNISEGTLNKRIRSGWSIEQAVGLESPPHRNIGNRKACQFLGRKFASKKKEDFTD